MDRNQQAIVPMIESRSIVFPSGWLTAGVFERILERSFPPAFSDTTHVVFRFHPLCKVMVDAAVCLLSLANQLIARGMSVTLVFEGESNEAMGYLHRANFFTCLSTHIHIMPERPDPIYAVLHQGNNKNLVEFKPLSQADYDACSSIPVQLKDALETAIAARSDRKPLCQTAYTLLGELIDNVYCHSQTTLNGFAALQVYRNGGKVLVVVSDSGVGLLETLKPKLLSPSARFLEDPELVALLFQGDVFWQTNGRGAGLKRCADLAHRHGSTVSIRLATSRVSLRPSRNGYGVLNMQSSQGLSLLQGTHLCFSIPLDLSA